LDQHPWVVHTVQWAVPKVHHEEIGD